MSVLDIKTFPDKILRQPSKPVINIDGTTQDLIDNMTQTLYKAPGIGLAAIQVGVDQSLIVYDLSSKEEGGSLTVLINPEIVEQEGQIVSENEGCLSVPDLTADVKRSARVQVEAYDRDGNPVSLEAEGLLAIMLQHEIDHLEGKLFIDHISKLKRELYTRKRNKQLKIS